MHTGVTDTPVHPTLSIIFANSKPYSKMFQPVYLEPRGSCLMKKQVKNIVSGSLSRFLKILTFEKITLKG
jgi:hypothetical protein